MVIGDTVLSGNVMTKVSLGAAVVATVGATVDNKVVLGGDGGALVVVASGEHHHTADECSGGRPHRR